MTPPLAPFLQKARNWKELQGRLAALDRKAQGDLFETLCHQFLRWHPAYSQLFAEVWLEADIPLSVRKHCQLPKGDKGLDGLALTRDGRYFGIQCKYLSDTKGSLSRQAFATATDQAFTQSRHIDGLVLMTTRERVTSEAARYRYDFIQITLGDWEELSGESWTQFRAFVTGESRKALPKPYKPRMHQRRALQNAHRHFLDEGNTRGKLIHPCGSGKSLTGFWLAEALGARKIVVAVPSLTLVRQTYRTWLREFRARGEAVDWLAVCSDKSVGRLSRLEEDEVVGSLQELGVDAHTDPAFIAAWLSRETPRRQVVFTTYQSGEALSEGVRRADYRFDTGIFDEAHKTVGQSTKLFSHLLHDEHIPVARRIYMTATERVFRGAGDEILSMDDPAVYGETFDFFSFKQAIESDPPVLTDYKVLVLAVTQAEIQRYIEDNVLIRTKGVRWDDDVEASMLASLIALNKAHQQYGIRHTVSFHGSIARAVAFRENQERINALGLFTPMDTFHVTGRTSTSERNREIEAFASSDNGLITNARCLTEGVDVPNIDCVLFADPRHSKVDIVQAVGRALRLAKNKDVGHVLVPLVINEANPKDWQENPAFKTIISILRALATLDDRMVEEVKIKVSAGIKGKGANPFLEGFAEKIVTIDIQDFIDKVTIQSWESIKRIGWLPFHEARAFVHRLGLRSVEEWILYTKDAYPNAGKKPADIPSSPKMVYAKYWIGYGDWLGTGNLAPGNQIFKSFEESRDFVRSLNFSTVKEWNAYAKSGTLPPDIPRTPSVIYKDEGWISTLDWIGKPAAYLKNVNYLPFEDARGYIRNLGLKSQTEWIKYLKSGQRPTNIPSNPRSKYANDWNGWADWLGTDNIANRYVQYLDFDAARQFARSRNIRSIKEWKDYVRENKPKGIPIDPAKTYASKGWVNWADWLGNRSKRQGGPYKTFTEARAYARSLNLRFIKEWKIKVKNDALPNDIPWSPDIVYKKQGWNGWEDWIGEGYIQTKGKEFWDFEQARKYTHGLGLRNTSEWVQFRKSAKRPSQLPANPSAVYKDKGWISWFDWLGISEKTTSSTLFTNFQAARAFVHKLGLKTSKDWVEYCRSGQKPLHIPSAANRVYKNDGWVSWADWLGHSSQNRPRKNFKNFEEARAFARKLHLESPSKWLEYCRSGQRPDDIPAAPNVVYKDNGWNSWSDWLRKSKPENLKGFISFQEARKLVHSLKLSNRIEWEKFVGEGQLPVTIPRTPRKVYKDSGWKGWGDWLGTYRKAVSEREYLPFDEVRKMVIQMKIKSIPQWNRWAKEHRPDNIPFNPSQTYAGKGWVSWAHFFDKEK